jgi:hypothetical protein
LQPQEQLQQQQHLQLQPLPLAFFVAASFFSAIAAWAAASLATGKRNGEQLT